MKDVFKFKNYQYNFRRDLRLQCRNVNTVFYSTETVNSLRATKFGI